MSTKNFNRADPSEFALFIGLYDYGVKPFLFEVL
jgi:hypothetical protein